MSVLHKKVVIYKKNEQHWNILQHLNITTTGGS